MKVLKFGGTSVGSAENLEKVRKIIRTQGGEAPVTVVSAHSGVTNELLAQAKSAARGSYSVEGLRERHRALYREIGVDSAVVEPLLEELDDLLRGLSLVRELTPRSLDLVASFGERLSVRGIAAYLSAHGLPAVPVDATEIGLLTDSRFTSANPDPACYPEVRRNLLAIQGGMPLVTGFIARDREGNITTLGRSGSDFSATLLGAALDAEEVQIWTDVDGVMTADPRVVKSPRSIPLLTIAEASELAYYGAKVIHPATMLPAVERRIPVVVRNTSRPDHPGTAIVSEGKAGSAEVKSIASKRGITLVTVASSRMLLQSGFMAKIFEVFARYDLSVDLVATSEVTVSVTVDDDGSLDRVVKDLAAFSEVTVQRDVARSASWARGSASGWASPRTSSPPSSRRRSPSASSATAARRSTSASSSMPPRWMPP
ncbi:MAG: aspartate kinase [Planctomycetes bacterium]|nr:aspartate kinase [Planctomycetota bacterium]